MQKNISLLDAAKTTQDFQTAANAFERIGEAEKTQWLPYYYAGLSLARAGWMDPAIDKDANSARIKSICEKAMSIEKNSEIYSLLNMAATQEMMVDLSPAGRPMGRKPVQAMKKVSELDPTIALVLSQRHECI